MKVLIVAKTRQGSGACIGAITFEGQSVRLIAADAEWNETAGMEYEVGEVWELEATPAKEVIPPHVENIIVRSKRKLPPLRGKIQFIKRHMPPVRGGPELLYEGLTQATKMGGMYIAEKSGVPSHSTAFWIPDRPLVRDEDGRRIHYRYEGEDGCRRLTFVGFQGPPETIPAGTLVRVSLAHWWRPREKPHKELRCYVQLSGWFMEEDDDYAEFGDPEPHESWVGIKTAPPPAAATAQATAPAGTQQSAQERPPNMDEAQRLLEQVFGYDSFWPLQGEVIANLLKRRDTLAIMPTGSGKSLCYQLPALMFGGLTVVVSPLISLMQDQVDQLRQLEIPAVFLNSTLSYEQHMATANRVRSGEVKLLYLAPETLLRPETLLMLDNSNLDCLAIDEAHCISSWGHDFRPEYRQLLPVRERFSEAVCFALTATATKRVQRDISDILGFEDSDEFVASFDRKNLLLAARPRSDGLEQILAFLEKHRDQSGIIYCTTRKQVDELAETLSQEGWSVLPYHAGHEDLVRRKHQRQFVRDDVQIIVATIAFGMGIDKSNVRFVVHANMPGNIESYYQEIGRAGRDGLQSDCLLLYSSEDLSTRMYFINQGAESERAGRMARLQAMMRYAQANSCRRIPLLGYFGEEYTGDPCGMCDYCLSQEAVDEGMDVTIAAQKFLSCVKRTGEIFGAVYITKVLRGSREKRVLERRHDKLSTYGIGMEYSEQQWKQLAQRFIQQGLLRQDLEHGGLSLTPRAYDVLKGEKVLIPLDEEWVGLGEAARPDYDQDLFDRLRTLRKEIADGANVPAYVVFSDRALAEMATYYPQSTGNFLAISGVGEAKLEKYGARFMSLISAYCGEREIMQGNKPIGKSTATRSGKQRSRRSKEVGELFAGGQSISQLQERFGVKKGTVVSHLYRYQQSGHDIDARRLLEASELTAEEQQRVMAAFDELGPDLLRPVFDALEEKISYDELHIMRLYYLCQA